MPGVYLFKKGRAILYIGKATNLRDRARSYFDDDLIATRGPRVADMVTKADRLAYETTPTVLEALVREAALIKKYRPPANVEGKDDSTFLYAVVTQEEIPRVLILRGKDVDFKMCKTRSNLKSESSRFDLVLRGIYGPFPSGAQLREGLRLIRKIFPFFDTPRPLDFARGKPAAKNKHQRANIEFNQQIRHFPRQFNKKEYRNTIRRIMFFLGGRGKQLRTMLGKEMRLAAKEERFEDAAELRRQLFALNHIQDVSLIKDENIENSPSTSSGRFVQKRIEAYDIAHLSGANAIGAMAVIVNGLPVKKEYRTFNIRNVKKNDDIASLKEILSRRFNHLEWPFPNAVVVDGGKMQKKAAENVLKEKNINIPVAAIVKDEQHRPREIISARLAHISEADAVLANSEAHRFSLARHRKARSLLIY